MTTPRSKLTRPAILSFALLAAPVTLIGMSAPPAPPKPTTTKPAMELPAAKELLMKALDAAGGQAAFKEVKTLSFDVTITTPQGDQSINVKTLRPNSVCFEQPTPTGNMMKINTNGKYAWVESPQDTGMQVMPANQMGPLQSVLNVQMTLATANDRFKEVKTAEKTEHGGKPAYRIEAVEKLDETTVSIFVDAESGEFLGQKMSFATPMGAMDAVTTITEWEELDGRKLVRALNLSMGPQTLPFKYSNYELNQVDESIFEMPESIKEQIKAIEEAEKAAEEGDTGDDKETGDGGGGNTGGGVGGGR